MYDSLEKQGEEPNNKENGYDNHEDVKKERLLKVWRSKYSYPGIGCCIL